MFLLLGLQTASPLSPPPIQVTKPVAAADTVSFRSEPLKFSYTLPAGIHAETNIAEQALKEETDKATGVKKAAAECVSIPLLAMDETENFRMVSVMRMDQTCLGSSTTPSQLGSIATQVLTESLKRLGEPQVGTPLDYKLGEHGASLLVGSAKSEKLGVTFHAAISCALVEKDIACWEFLAVDPAVLAQLTAIPVHFDGHDPLPVVPAEIIAKAK